ncbi:hypothetical protein ABZ924_21945 [Streptomyces sp. NPDC046876]|uniref:hypothetical protein n=1 Tax=Streptomyces sp. NPDC046876 TaxID=3155616 RepID=UPI00340964CF
MADAEESAPGAVPMQFTLYKDGDLRPPVRAGLAAKDGLFYPEPFKHDDSKDRSSCA